MPVTPITPAEVPSKKAESFPDAVLESFNELIVRHYLNGVSDFRQDDVIELMLSKGLDENEIFRNHWLDVEEVYDIAGWKVGYYKPGYNEPGSAYFTFTKK